MFCCSKRKKVLLDPSEAKKNDLVGQVIEKTQFTPEEVNQFYVEFIGRANDNYLTIKQFQDLLSVMGIRISSSIEERIFKVIDKQIPGKLNFTEIMTYFNIILKGTKKQRMHFCYRLIDSDNKGYFTIDNLTVLLKEIHNSTEDSEDMSEDLETLAVGIFQMMGLIEDEEVGFDRFMRIIEEKQEVYELFSNLGSNVSNLLDVQGQNKYTRIVSVLDDVFTTFRKSFIATKIKEDLGKSSLTQIS